MPPPASARAVFANLLGELPKVANVGLEVFGHYGDKDCSVIEVLAPVRPLDAAAINAKVDSLQPRRGATPIAASLEMGAEVLKKLSGSKVMILISDGEETCGGDPIGVAKRIREEFGIELAIHVVGFDVGDKERAQLAALADCILVSAPSFCAMLPEESRMNRIFFSETWATTFSTAASATTRSTAAGTTTNCTAGPATTT